MGNKDFTETTIEVIFMNFGYLFEKLSQRVKTSDTPFDCQVILLYNVNHAPLYKSKIAQYYTIKPFYHGILAYYLPLFQALNRLNKYNK